MTRLSLSFIIPLLLLLCTKGYAQEDARKFSVVCSFKCASNNSSVITQCFSAQGIMAAVKPIEPFNVNAYAEFDLVIATLKKDRDNPYPLSYSFRSCDHVCNAASVMIDSLRYIYYNPAFLNNLSSTSAQLKWVVRSIIAHEIGHHLLDHTLPGQGNLFPAGRRRQELHADYFSAFVIKQFPGATIDDALSGIRSLNAATYIPRNDIEESTSDYPTLANRETAIREAFEADNNSPLRIAMFKSLDSVALATAKRSGSSIILHELDRAIAFNNMKEALEKINLLKQLPVSNEEKSAIQKLENIATEQVSKTGVSSINPSSTEMKKEEMDVLKNLYEELKKKKSPADKVKAEALLKSIKELESRQQ